MVMITSAKRGPWRGVGYGVAIRKQWVAGAGGKSTREKIHQRKGKGEGMKEGKQRLCDFCSSTAALRCDVCGADYCLLCASEPDEGGFNCPDEVCPGYGLMRRGLVDYYKSSEGVEV